MASRPRVATIGGAGPAAWLPLLVLALAGVVQLLGTGPAILVGLACFFAGLSHGAGDENGGRIVPYRLHHAAGYLLSGLAVAALFLAAPLFALAVFLLLSAWHVGRSDGGWRARDWAIGALLIGGSALFRPGSTSEIFSSLLGQAIPAPFVQALAAIGIAGCALAFLAAWRKERGWALAPASVLAALAFHPVLAAGVIFLIGHAAPVQTRQLSSYGWAQTWRAVRWPLGIAGAGSLLLAIGAMQGLVALPVIAALAFGLATPHMLAERLET